MALQELVNNTFPTIESLHLVDTIITQLTDPQIPTQPLSLLSSTPTSSASAAKFLSTLKQLANDATPTSLEAVDTLINHYGTIPVITYTREIIVQKLELLLEKQKRSGFVEVLDKINDFEIFDVNNLSDSLSYGNKVDMIGKVSALSEAIEKFKLEYNEESLSNQLSDKLDNIVSSKLKVFYIVSLTKTLKNWERNVSLNAITEFKLLLHLQTLSKQPPETIWALDCLLHGFKIKFEYHFQGKNETNRLEKPEFALSYATGYLQVSLPEAKSAFSAVFAETIQNTAIMGSFSTWFITSLLAVIRQKFTKEIAYLVETYNLDLLSHHIEEIKKFDQCVKFKFAYVPIKGAEWDGLTKDIVLDNNDVWNNWLQNEKKFVNTRFEEITGMENAFEIDYEIVASGHTKPTKSAVNLQNLIENITASYKSLPLKFQLKFLSEVQLKLLNFYFDTLKNGVQALKNIKSVKIDGVSTLERICRIWCSAKYMIEKMSSWSNETIFIELWASLTSENNNSTFFESVISGYQRDILDKIPKLLNTYFERQLNINLKEYFQENSTWTQTEILPISSTLSYLIQSFNYDIAYFKKTVSHATFSALKLTVSNMIASYFEKHIALSNNFTNCGVDKLANDVEYVFSSLQLVKSYESYARLQTIMHVLKHGDVGDQAHESIDSSMVSMLQMRRR